MKAMYILGGGLMAVQFPDVFITWVDNSTRQITPGTTSGTYNITNDGTSSGTIVDNGDDTFTLNLTNLKTVAILWVSFPWQSNEEPLGGESNDDIHYIPRLGGIQVLNNLLTAYGWTSYAYPGNVVSPFSIRTDDTEARIVAAANWPPRYCNVQYSLNRNIIVYYDDYISRAAGSSPTFTATAFYKKISGTGTISQPMWMQALDYYKSWLHTKLEENDIEPITYPEWLRQSHGFFDVQLENINAFDVNDLEDEFRQWSNYLPWLQMWGQMSEYAGGCCSREDVIDARYTGLTTLAENLVNEGYRVGFYTKPPDIIKDSGNYIPLDGSTGHLIDDSDASTNIQTISDNSVTISQNAVTATSWDAGIQVDDIIHLTKSGFDQYVTVKRIGTAADGDADTLYVDSKVSFTSGLNASVDRYSGGTLNSLDYFTGWISKSIGGSFKGNVAYADVLAVAGFGDPITLTNYLKDNTINDNIFTEGVADIIPRAGSYSGSIAVGSTTMSSGTNVASIANGGSTITLSSGNFGTQLREWDTTIVGTGLFLIDSTAPARTNLSYTFDSATTSGPGSGEVRINNASYGSATNIYVHETDSGATDRAAFWATVVANWRIRIYKTGDLTLYLDATVTSNTDSGTYRTLGITPITTKNSFTDGDSVTVEISPLITSLTTKAPSSAAYTNQSYTAYRWVGYPGKTTNNITSTLDNSVAFIPLVRYLLPKRMSILGEVNVDFWFWGGFRGANYHVERQAFLLGMKFDAITPEDTVGGTTIDQVLGIAIPLRDEHDWWDRDFEYKHQIGISNISNASVDIRRFTDSEGYDVFVVDNWDQVGVGTFDFNTTTYDFTNEQLQIIDTRPAESSSSGASSSSIVRTYTNISFANITKAKYTEITSPFTNGLVTYEFRRKDLPTERFSVNTGINLSKYPQIKSIDSTQISIELPERTTYQVRMRKGNGTWTAWTDFTTRKIDFDHPSQNSKTTVTKTRKGATVVNTDTGFSTVKSVKKTRRGAIVDNTKIDYKE